MTPKESLGFTALSLLLPFLLPGLQAGCTAAAPTALEQQRPQAAPRDSELQRLQGTWEGVVVGDKSEKKHTITVTGNSFHFHRDSNFWFATTITLPADTDPRQLHATIDDCAPGQESSVGQVVVAIFKIEDGLLTLAASGGGGEETPKSFEAAEDQGLTLYELRKVQPQTKGDAIRGSELSPAPVPVSLPGASPGMLSRLRQRDHQRLPRRQREHFLRLVPEILVHRLARAWAEAQAVVVDDHDAAGR